LPCDCCGARKEKFLLEKDGTLTKRPFKVIQCRKCGFVYINPRLSEEGISALYNDAYYNGQGFDSYVNYVEDYSKHSDDEKLFHPLKIAESVESFLTSDRGMSQLRVLDYGCGLGDLMKQLRTSGIMTEGFEISEFARNFARKEGFLVYGDAQEIPSNSYDLVVAIEVLEHLYSPTSGLQQIFRVLKPGGKFVYSTYDIDIFLLKRFLRLAADDPYIVPEGHVNFFGRKVMRRYFRKVGFSSLGPDLRLPERSVFATTLKNVLGLRLPSAVK
jgi:SAM-dependent methyltransferase